MSFPHKRYRKDLTVLTPAQTFFSCVQLASAFTDGEVTVQKEASNAGKEVIQLVQQVNPLSLQSHIARINTPLPKSGKYPQCRNIDTSQLFSICPVKTPEGEGAGLLQNLTVASKVRVSVDMDDVAKLLMQFEGVTQLDDSHRCLVYLNSDPIGRTTDPLQLLEAVREARRTQRLPQSLTVVLAPYGVLVTTDIGVVTFPLLVLKNIDRLNDAIAESELGGTNLWQTMLNYGIVEYMDAWESMDYVVAFKYEDALLKDKDGHVTDKLDPEFTHLAPHPTSFFSTAAGTIPFANHNQAPRNCFPVLDHEILTEHGFLKLPDILKYTEGDAKLGVACYTNGGIEWHKIGRDRVVYDVTSKDFIKFENDDLNISIVATANHNMYGRVGEANITLNGYAWKDGQIPSYATMEAGHILHLSTTMETPVMQLLCVAKHSYGDYRVDSAPWLNIKNHISEVKMETEVPIFCVTVPTKEHLIIVRRNDGRLSSRPTVVGNTYQCLDPQETVLVQGKGRIAIGTVRKNDIVAAYDFSKGSMTWSKVLHQYVDVVDRDCVQLWTIGGRRIKCTWDHLIWTRTRGWIRARELSTERNPLPFGVDDVLIMDVTSLARRYERVEYVVQDTSMTMLCDITLDHADHAFFAGGDSRNAILVHNSGMAEQAISAPCLSVFDRHEMNYRHLLWYPQKPVCTTHIAEVKGLNTWPMGSNAILAIAPYFTSEDSITYCSASEEFGMMRVTVMRSHRAVAKKRGTDVEVFEHPMNPHASVKCVGLRGECDYSKLGADGLPLPGTWVKNNDIIIGRTGKVRYCLLHPKRSLNLSSSYSCSTYLRHLLCFSYVDPTNSQDATLKDASIMEV